MMWAIELELENYATGEVITRTLDPVHECTMIQLVQVMACYELDGIRYYSVSQPIADLNQRKLVYRFAGYPSG